MKFAVAAALLSAGALAAPASHSQHHFSPSLVVPTTHAIVRPTRTSPPKIHATESGGFWKHHQSGSEHPHWPVGWQPTPGHAHLSGVALPTGTGGLPLVPWTAEHLDSAARPTKRHAAEDHEHHHHKSHAWTFVSGTATYTHPHRSVMHTGSGGLPLVPLTAIHSKPSTKATATASHSHSAPKRDGSMPFKPRQAEEDIPQVYKVYEI